MKALTAGTILARAAGEGARHVAAARVGVVRLSGVSGSVRTLMLGAAALEAGRCLVVTAHERAASAIRQDLEAALAELAGAAGVRSPTLLSFPPLEADPYQGIAAHPRILAERAGTLAAIRRLHRWVVVTPLAALTAPLLPPEQFDALFLRLRSGEEFPFEALQLQLERAGYERVDLASSPGDWARRGGIFDIYPPGLADPVRVELEEDQIASLRLFDPLTQRSLEERSEVDVPPAREAPLDHEARQILREKLEKMPRTGGRLIGTDPLEALAVEGRFAGIELCAGLWAGRETDLLSYGDRALLVLDEPYHLEAEAGQLLGDLAAAREVTSTPLPEPSRLLLPLDRLGERLAGARLELHDLSIQDDAGKGSGLQVEVAGRTPRAYNGRLLDLVTDLSDWAAAGRHTLLLLETEGLLERTREVLTEHDLNPVLLPATLPAGGELPRLALARGRLSHGFELDDPPLTVLGERDIFGERRRPAPRGGRHRTAMFRSDFRDLAVGDLVVHIDHGIGRYQGIRRLGEGEGAREFMVLVYRRETVLYVPVDRLDLVQKYSGVGGKLPQLDRLGAPAWDKARKKVRHQVQDLAEQLLELYAARGALTGRAFSADTPFQAEFEAAFPYQVTPDQQQAIADVYRDMESGRCMDRLLCGDVGFGKTEVAMRAAFKAMGDGAQVAMLAPTTVLAFQHFNTLRDRFAPFPVTVELMSRFTSRTEQRDVLRRLREGSVDIVVGTHRLLSKDVQFKNLGLLVVDEEQRFGVSHKERLKQISRNVDVLTLTATPLPRTLQMSMAGVRDMSIIETPPENRMSIQTVLLPFRTGVIVQAIRRELRRDGQVFFVHNRIGSIDAMATVIRREIPDVTLEVAHGRLDEKQLEKVMLRFMAGEIQVLLSTTIIENGLDIPRANTIIINRADRFGLAQLYQIRGRVGRSDVPAYAYLLIPPRRQLTDVARRRLKALQEFSDLGAGFRVAARDLEIRGAGDLLGARQHGHIAAMGFDLYCRMLEAAVQEKKGEAPPAPEVRVSVDLQVDYRLPENYVGEAHQRLILYKRVAAAAESGDMDSVREEIQDRYGHLPREVENLLAMAAIRAQAEALGIVQLGVEKGCVILQFVENAPVDGDRLLAWIQSGTELILSPSGVVSMPVDDDPEERLEQVGELLGHIRTQAGRSPRAG
ncbi:MAG: transcription-repair coupling factor [Acidobacteria bacterium]|nr:transcription-repair coupling factor [Acidobacteriota bacterium]